MDKNGPPIVMSSPGTESKKLNTKPMELINVSNIKQELNTEFHKCKTDVEFKENIGESSSNLLDSTRSVSKVPDTPNSNSKSLELNDVFQPPSPIGKIQVVTGLENKQGETHNHGPAVPCSFGKTSILEDGISSKLSKIEIEVATRNVLCDTKPSLSAVGMEIVISFVVLVLFSGNMCLNANWVE